MACPHRALALMLHWLYLACSWLWFLQIWHGPGRSWQATTGLNPPGGAWLTLVLVGIRWRALGLAVPEVAQARAGGSGWVSLVPILAMTLTWSIEPPGHGSG